MKKIYVSSLLLMAVMGALCPVAKGQEPRRMTIPEMFAAADSLNASIAKARHSGEEAQAAVDVAKSAYLPSIQAQASVSWNALGHSFDRDFTHWTDEKVPGFGNTFSLEVNQVIWAGGAIKAGVEAAELGTKLSELSANQKTQEVRLLLAQNALEVARLENQVRVLDENIAVADTLLVTMKARVAGGTALSTDVTRYELMIQNLKLSRVNVTSAIEILSRQMGSAIGTGPVLPLVDDSVLPDLAAAMNMCGDASGSSFAVRSASAARELALTKEKLTRAELHPQIALFTADNLNGPDITTFISGKMAGYGLLDKNFNFAAIGVGIRYNLDNLYKAGRKIRQSHAAVQRADAGYREALSQIEVAAEAAYIGLRDSYAKLEMLESSSRMAHENYDVVASRYDGGLAIMTELLDASQAALTADMNLASGRMETIGAFYKLSYICGTL